MDIHSRLLLVSIAVLTALLLYLAHAVSRTWLVTLPPDYFAHATPRRPMWLHVVRTTVGAILIVAGILMLALPGPGVLTMFLGILVIDGGAKRALMRRLLHNDRIRAALDSVRHRAGQPPLLPP